jgi:hypothetical protein
MFDFLGVFTPEQYAALKTYLQRKSLGDALRLETLRREAALAGWVVYQRDPATGVPTSWSVQPQGVPSRMSGLTSAFTLAGGDLLALDLRSRGDWVYFTRGEFRFEAGGSFRGGLPSRGGYFVNRHADDGVLAATTDRYKRWAAPRIRRELEDLEYAIKATLDYSDQCLIEAIELYKRVSGTETLAALESILEEALASPQDFDSLRFADVTGTSSSPGE